METPVVRCHKDLILWQKAMDLAVAVHRASLVFPKSELFGLTVQLRRAAVSVASNVAEGSARRSTREFVHFLRIARGSLAEAQTQIRLAQRVGFLANEQFAAIDDQIDEVGRILNAVLSGLGRRLKRHSD